jgi:hypothetical protein
MSASLNSIENAHTASNMPTKTWTAAELRALPPDQRDAVLEIAAALAEKDYRNDPQLTAFDAFGKDDLYGDGVDPSVGAEIQKVRPALVINLDAIGRLPLRAVVPITDWKSQYAN